MLVIEDSQVIGRLIEVCLRPLGVEITLAGDGRSGLAAAAAEVPDLVVLDIGLPGINGWEVLDRLRESDLTADVPVMVLTGHADQYGAFAGRAASAFMTKPFQPGALRRQVSGLLPAAVEQMPNR